MESPDGKPTGLYETTCLLGYGMLPLLLHALLCLLAPRYTLHAEFAHLSLPAKACSLHASASGNAGMHVYALSN